MSYFNEEENEQENTPDIQTLLKQYKSIKAGNSSYFWDEDQFEIIIDYFDMNQQLDNAIEAVDVAVSQFPYSAQLLVKKADLYIAKGFFKDSLELLKDAEKMDADAFNVNILKTEIYLAMDKNEKAFDILEDTKELFDGIDREDYLMELSQVFDDYEEYEQVYDCLYYLLEKSPNNDEALQKLCFWTEITGRHDESVKLFQSIIDNYPYNQHAWFGLASSYQTLKLYEKAIDAYKYAVTINESFEQALRNIADCYLRLKEYDKAISYLDQVINLNQHDDIVFEAMGYSYDRLNQFTKARYYYRRALQVNPADTVIKFKIATTYMNEHQFETAIKMLHTLCQEDSKRPEYWHAYGFSLLQLGKYSQATEKFLHIIDLKPKFKMAWVDLMTSLSLGGNFDLLETYSLYALEHLNNASYYGLYYFLALHNNGKAQNSINVLHKYALNKKHIKEFIKQFPQVLQNDAVVQALNQNLKTKHRKTSSKNQSDNLF
jgi:tetratricopeptide (TPR) repeat protein